jgi:protein-L-isoaspartate(D-aspartate) O-methyltransferase
LVKAAFATVPRERFVGVGPWRVKSPWSLGEYWTTENADPRNVYHDVLIALDESLGLNNGQPSLWAFLFDKLAVAANNHVLHLGCGTGYYTAILAELVGLKEELKQSKLKQPLQKGRAQRLRRGHKLLWQMAMAPTVHLRPPT